MKPVEFKEANKEMPINNTKHNNIPVLILEGEEGYTVLCWKANFFERLKILFTGKVWVSTKTLNKPVPLSYISAFRKAAFSKPNDTRLGIWLSKLLTKK